MLQDTGSGDPAGTAAVLAAAPAVSAETAARLRFARALAAARRRDLDGDALAAARDRLLAVA